MAFKGLNLSPSYDSEDDDILQSFYLPMFKHAIRYDRAVGYFSSAVLSNLSEGLENFISSQGKIRLIIGDPLSDDEYEAVIRGKQPSVDILSQKLCDLLIESHDLGLKIITYLIANQQLEIKFAVTHRGMFHKKIGIFYDEHESVVFSGSANETLPGLTKYNSEEIKVFFSWNQAGFELYGKPEIEKFSVLWNDKNKRTRVIPLSSDAYLKIRNSADRDRLYKEIFNKLNTDNPNKPFYSYTLKKGSEKIAYVTAEDKIPRKPLMIKGRPFGLFKHQLSAIESWIRSDYKGLFKLATGAGKTVTSICATVELFEELVKANQKLFVVIAVPYIELANQWVEELKAFNISAVKCYESSSKWVADLDKKILRLKADKLKFACAVVVNRTLGDDKFQSRLKKIDSENLMIIGDECHHLASQSLFNKLPDCSYRIGLSATPFRCDDEMEGSPFKNVAKENLLSYFGGIVSEYSLIDAINDDILTPYTYDIVPVHLNEIEQEGYEYYSERIQHLILKAQSNDLNPDEKQRLTSLCGQRSRLLATCQEKLPALISYLKCKKLPLSHSLIYVGEGKAPDEDENYILKVTNALHEEGERVAKFTSEETATERKNIMDDFKNGYVNALVAMKVLDEGIDVPICSSAFILASTRNPRQYVQRRGRVLRKAEQKSSALIVDFVVLPQKGSNNHFSQNLKRAECQRIDDFKHTAQNGAEVEKRILELGIM